MTGLVFKKLWLVSKIEKAARRLELKPGLNLLTGENDVGKSTLIKSLYHTIGADVPNINNSRWKNANPIYCVQISINDQDYFIVRDGKFFGVFDENKSLISQHQGITTENGIAHFICPKFQFRVELERAQNATLGLAGPAYYFLPYYIDQEEGWTASWSSFQGLRQFRNYRKLMIEYHLGVRPQRYYDAKKRELELEERVRGISHERQALSDVAASYRRKKAASQFDIDPSAFRAEMEQLVDEYNAAYVEQQEVLVRIKQARNSKNGIDTDLEILTSAIQELNADYTYAESPDRPEHVDCPTCGTTIENSYVERFGILDDIEYCQSLLDQKKKERIEAEEKLKGIEEEYQSFSSKVKSIDELLNERKNEVSLSEVITSEGIKELLSSISTDVSVLIEQEDAISEEINLLSDDLKLDSRTKKSIVEFYRARMKQYLNELNVDVLEEADYKTLDKVIKSNAIGSDLPRSLLAQYFAFLSTMQEFNSQTICPLVIDSPQQQEQDSTNLDAIFSFIIKHALGRQQVIIGTINTDQCSANVIPDDAHQIEFTDKLRVLQKDQFDQAWVEIGELHTKTLALEE